VLVLEMRFEARKYLGFNTTSKSRGTQEICFINLHSHEIINALNTNSPVLAQTSF
jgi:hypothetical protein